MGLDTNFFISKKRIQLNKVNKCCLKDDVDSKFIDYEDLGLEEYFYFRKYYDLNAFIQYLWKSENPEDVEKYDLNGLYIELSKEMLKQIIDVMFDEIKYFEEDKYICDRDSLKEFYSKMCTAYFLVDKGFHFYIESDW